ncbi:unnamed protein product [Phytophthora lilii]|uniref:Unnamed protein product n=1 Tax=Phytophthora lilii TaxID=2077276 RepID=A0A9W6XR32_9STRA|nr:unnamed protein product [Phytophthora lilii]GMF44082.1 unnamed protein product [Phytophthora lilii]
MEPPVLRPAITSMSVVLPAPVDPMSAVMDPGIAYPLMPLSSVSDSLGLCGSGTEYHRSWNAMMTGSNFLAVALTLSATVS